MSVSVTVETISSKHQLSAMDIHYWHLVANNTSDISRMVAFIDLATLNHYHVFYEEVASSRLSCF